MKALGWTLLLVIVAGCESGGSRVEPIGQAGGPCRQNQLCASGLVCCSGTCVERESAPDACVAAPSMAARLEDPSSDDIDFYGTSQCNACPPSPCALSEIDPLTRQACEGCYREPCPDAAIVVRPPRTDASADAADAGLDAAEDSAAPDAAIDAPSVTPTDASAD